MNPAPLKLYEANGSPNSRRVRIFIAEKSICLMTIPVDLATREQFSDAYAAINPRRVVPTLLLADGTGIGEVPAIWRYLEEVHPDRPLLGIDAKDKALVTMWERRAELEGFAPVMEAVRNASTGLKGRAISGPHDYEQIAELVDRGRRRLADYFEDLDARLADVPFVAGDRYSVADITTLVTIDFALKALGQTLPEGHTHSQRWYRATSSRPSSSV